MARKRKEGLELAKQRAAEAKLIDQAKKQAEEEKKAKLK